MASSGDGSQFGYCHRIPLTVTVFRILNSVTVTVFCPTVFCHRILIPSVMRLPLES